LNSIIEKLTGFDKMTDQVIATDFLISSKCGLRSYAVAITETASPELRATLVSQLNDFILTHERITDYMMSRGYYHAYHLQEQYQVDMKVTDTALQLKDTMI
jgi:similar to spore coat protein